uniref:Uncharacterized protein n=1 Tax=Magallana gigas TaxID=29159 RepID=K1PXA0_MAGGI
MAILQTTTIVTSGAGPVKVPGSSPLGAETVTDSILECVSDQILEKARKPAIKNNKHAKESHGQVVCLTTRAQPS